MSGVNYSLQDKFLDAFFSSRFGRSFYLTGGTALARYYFHHRESFDLDLFTHDQGLDFSALSRLMLDLGERLGLVVKQQVTVETFLQFIFQNEKGENLKVDFVKDIIVHFGKVLSRGNVRIDSLENIASNKILAVFGRTEPKDFIDLYFILKSKKFTFEELFERAKKKDLGLSEFYLANSLAQIGQTDKRLKVYKEFDWDEMVKFYDDLSRKLFLQNKPGR